MRFYTLGSIYAYLFMKITAGALDSLAFKMVLYHSSRGDLSPLKFCLLNNLQLMNHKRENKLRFGEKCAVVEATYETSFRAIESFLLNNGTHLYCHLFASDIHNQFISTLIQLPFSEQILYFVSYAQLYSKNDIANWSWWFYHKILLVIT